MSQNFRRVEGCSRKGVSQIDTTKICSAMPLLLFVTCHGEYHIRGL